MHKKKWYEDWNLVTCYIDERTQVKVLSLPNTQNHTLIVSHVGDNINVNEKHLMDVVEGLLKETKNED